MSTGTPFTPTPFTTSVVTSEVASAYRRAPYISPTEFRSAPTALATNNLVPGGTDGQQLQALADTIMRASSWVDEHCFHTADGTLAASPSTEQGWIRPKGDGSLNLICNYRPILEVQALAVGPTASQLSSFTTAPSIGIGLKTISVWPFSLGVVNGDYPTFPMATSGGRIYAVWTYVNGYPHTSLAANCTAGADSIQVAPSTPDGATVSGVYPGTPLTIHDGVDTETVVVSTVSGTTLNLSAGTLYAHTVPEAPDSIRVSALPWAIEQAAISMTSCLIKMRGTTAAVLPMQPGPAPARDALIEAGGLGDFEVACKLLRPFTSVYHGNQ